MTHMNRTREITRFALYALVIVLLNIALNSIFFRIDLSANSSYSLTGVSREMVKNLEEPLTIKIYITENLPYPYNNLKQNLQDILTEYSIAGNRNFNYDINIMKNSEGQQTGESAEFAKEARSYGINPIQIQKVDQSEIKLISAYMGAVFIHADMIETIPVINPSENIEYLITSTISGMQEKTTRLLTLEEKIKMKLYLSSSLFPLSPDLAAYPGKLSDVVDSLNQLNYGRISFEWLDTDTETAAAAEASEYNLSPVTFRDERGRERTAYAAAVLEYGGDYTSFNVLNRGIFGFSIQNPEEIENDLNGVIERLIGVGNKVAWLSDHGTIPLYGGSGQPGEPAVSAFASLASSRYNVVPATTSEGGLPGDAGSLIITRPQPYQPFSDWDLFQIDQFLMKGGNIAVFMDGYMEYFQQAENSYQQQPPVYIPRNTGLEKLLAHYGVTVEQSYVLDENCFKQQQQTAEGISEIPIYFAPMIKPENINSSLPYLEGLPGLVMLNASPVTIDDELPEGRTAKVLYSSSEKSWLMDDPQQINLYNPMVLRPPMTDDQKQSFALAALLEGSFESYFADKGVPERPEKNEDAESGADFAIGTDQLKSEEKMLKTTDNCKIFVFGSSMALTDSLIDQNGTTSNAVMVLNVLDEMNGKGDFAVMRKKGLSYVPLDETPPAVKTFIKTFNIAVIPLIVILAGLLVWFRFKSRQKKIAAMFSEVKND